MPTNTATSSKSKQPSSKSKQPATKKPVTDKQGRKYGSTGLGRGYFYNKLEDPAKKKEKGKELSPADRRWINQYMTHGNSIKAAKAAYPDMSYATQLNWAKKNLDKFRTYLELLMETSGLDDMTLIGKLKEGLDATKIHGTQDDFIEIPDYMVRHKYLKTAAEWKGVGGGKNEKGGQTNIGEVKILVTRGDD